MHESASSPFRPPTILPPNIVRLVLCFRIFVICSLWSTATWPLIIVESHGHICVLVILVSVWIHIVSYRLSFWLSPLPFLSLPCSFRGVGEGNLYTKGNVNGIAGAHRIVDNNPCIMCWVGLIMRYSWTNEEWEERQQELRCMNGKNELGIKGGQQFGFTQDTPDSEHRAVRWLITWSGLVVGSGRAWAHNEGFTT